MSNFMNFVSHTKDCNKAHVFFKGMAACESCGVKVDDRSCEGLCYSCLVKSGYETCDFNGAWDKPVDALYSKGNATAADSSKVVEDAKGKLNHDK